MEHLTIVFTGNDGTMYHINSKGPRERIEAVMKNEAKAICAKEDGLVAGALENDRIVINKVLESRGWVYNSEYKYPFGVLRIVKSVPAHMADCVGPSDTKKKEIAAMLSKNIVDKAASAAKK